MNMYASNQNIIVDEIEVECYLTEGLE